MKKLLGFMTMAIASTVTLTGCFGSNNSSNNNDGAGNISDGAPDIGDAPIIEEINYIGEEIHAEDGFIYTVISIDETTKATALRITGTWKPVDEVENGGIVNVPIVVDGIPVTEVDGDVFDPEIEFIYEQIGFELSHVEVYKEYNEQEQINDGTEYPGLGFNPGDDIYQEQGQDNNPNYYPVWDFGYDEEFPHNDGTGYPGLGYNPEDDIYQEEGQDNNHHYYPGHVSAGGDYGFGYDEEFPNNDASMHPSLGFDAEDDIYQEEGQVNDSQHYPGFGFEEPSPTVCLLENGWWTLTGTDNWDTLINKVGDHDSGSWLHWLQVASHKFDSLEEHCLAEGGEIKK